MSEAQRFDLGTLNVEQVIVHEVPKRGEGQRPLRLSYSTSPLEEPNLLRLIRDRIVRSIGLARTQIRFDPNLPGPTRDEVCSILLTGADGFVESSQSLATHLYQVQPKNASSGILLVAQASHLEGRGVTIMKMEPQEGASLIWSGDRCNIQRLAELMLTEQTKLYKVGHFVAPSEVEEEPIGFVADRQAGVRRVADFFLDRFLCCVYAESPKEVTRKLHEQTYAFINEKVASPESRARYGLSLVSELQSNDGTFCPQVFAQRHLAGSDREVYEHFIQEKGLDPSAAYPKNTVLIDRKLRVTSLGFEGGITVAGSQDAFDAHVTTEEVAEGKLALTVTDRLKMVKN